LKPEYDNNFTQGNAKILTFQNNKLNQTDTTSSSEDENPIYKFNKIKNEIDLIEKDLEFYKQNVNFIKIFNPFSKFLPTS
jgi:hypothetical protein